MAKRETQKTKSTKNPQQKQRPKRIKTLKSVPFSKLRIGQVVYDEETKRAFVITTLLAAFPDNGTPESHEIDFIGKDEPKYDTIEHSVLHHEAGNLLIFKRILTESEWPVYRSILAEIEKTL